MGKENTPSFISRFADSLAAFGRTGLFFMLFGTSFLYFAFENGARAHSAMTFILVVLGSAMVLFGTGTQASGDLDNSEAKHRYKVQIAGGAGVMSLVIGFGLVWKGPDLKGVFQPERRIVVAPLVAEMSAGQGLDAPVKLSDYVVEAFVGPIQVPIVHRDGFVELFIPVTSADFDPKSQPIVFVRLTHRRPVDLPSHVDPSPSINRPLELYLHSKNRSGGYEFTRYEQNINIPLIKAGALAVNKLDVKTQNSEMPTIKIEGY